MLGIAYCSKSYGLAFKVTQLKASSNMERKESGTCEHGNRNHIGAHGIER